MKQAVRAQRQRYWDLRAAGNFIGGGAGTGLLLASAFAALQGLPVAAPSLVGAGLVGLGLALVWLEIGKPWRAFNVFFHPQTSWMTREGILAAPLMAMGAAAAWFAHPLLSVAAGFLAAAFLYCQARILRASRGIPAWSHRRMSPLILATGLAEGAGLLLAFGAFSPLSVGWALAAALAREAAYARYMKGLAKDGAPAGTVACFASPTAQALRFLRMIALMLLAAGLAGIPLCAEAGGLLAALTGWGFKALLIARAAFTRGARIPRTPMRGRGMSHVVTAVE